MAAQTNLEQEAHMLTDPSRAALPRPSDGPQPPQTPAPLPVPKQETRR